MKKVYSILLSFTIFCSCQNDIDNEMTPLTLTSEITKTETVLQQGEIKNENNQTGEKIETELRADLKEKMILELDSKISKQQTFLRNAGRTVGVFKNGTCGKYPVLHVAMDCEDSRPKSKTINWVGDSHVDKNKNINLLFCVVDGAYFNRIQNHKYGILKLNNDQTTTSSGVHILKKYFDNEDSSNWQWTKLNDQVISDSKKPFAYGDCFFHNNTLLAFYYFENDYQSKNNDFPNLGISYGVLGKINGKENGEIFSDDEDGANGNYTLVGDKFVTGNYYNLVANDKNNNSTLFVSKVR